MTGCVMKKKTEVKSIDLPDSTIIEVVRTKDNEVIKKEMTVGEWKKLKKQFGYNYTAYQKGFSQY